MRVLWASICTVLWSIIFGFSGIFLTTFESNKGRTLGYCARLWGKFILFTCGIKYEVKGLNNLNPNSNYIFAGNHTSMLDIPIAFSGLPYWLVPIAKIELRSVILLGWVMRTAGHIFGDRKKSENAIRILEKTKKSLLDNPRSILLFPEGTRTQDGSIGPFKKGGLLLSLDTKMPIVPIAFIGGLEAKRKDDWRLRPGVLITRFGEPITLEEYGHLEVEGISELVRSRIETLIEG